MGDPAKYQFLSWLRRGVSTSLALAAGDTRATFEVEVAVKNGGIDSRKIKFSLFGAGDVTGLDTRVVTRAWPRPGARDAEPNHFPLIEFSHADLPWRYSPAPGDGSRVLPWLCLVVLRKGEVNFTPPIPGGKLGTLNVTTAALPDLSQSWAWAHTQFSGAENLDPNSLATKVDGEPERFLSRIIAPATPGLLQPDTEYTAFLMPTFRARAARWSGTKSCSQFGDEARLDFRRGGFDHAAGFLSVRFSHRGARRFQKSGGKIAAVLIAGRRGRPRDGCERAWFRIARRFGCAGFC
jgi:hypothetical protein